MKLFILQLKVVPKLLVLVIKSDLLNLENDSMRFYWIQLVFVELSQ